MNIKILRKLNRDMLPGGVLFVTFGWLLLAVKEPSEIPILWVIPPAPVLFYKILGGFALAISVVFLIAVFCECWAGKLKKAFVGWFRSVYWFVFLLVYSVSLSGGLSNFAEGSLAYILVACVGLVWWFVIAIIFLRACWQAGKRAEPKR